MNSSTRILTYFGCAIFGCALSLGVFHSIVLPQHKAQTKSVVTTLVKDLKSSKQDGALSVIQQCQDNGFAYIPDSKESGTYIDCNTIVVDDISKNEFNAIASENQQYSSKKK